MADDTTTELPSPGISLIFFLIITIGYFVYRYKTESGGAAPNTVVATAAYFLLIVIGQLFINNKLLQAICGESQWSTSLSITLIPWVLIFGLLLLFLNMFPSWRAPFSNTFGLFVAKLLGVKDLVEKMFDFDQINASWATTTVTNDSTTAAATTPTASAATPTAAPAAHNSKLVEALANIRIDNSIIINEFNDTPADEALWTALKNGGLLTAAAPSLKAQFGQIIHAKTLVADFVWFFLTGMLVTTVSYNYIVNSGCKTSLAEMKKRHEDYEDELTQQTSSAASSSQRVYDQT